jgi:hypothetical protein
MAELIEHKWTDIIKDLGVIPLLKFSSVISPVCIGWCGECRTELAGTEYRSNDLPTTHPGRKLDPPIAISFGQQIFQGLEVKESRLVCMPCALQEPEMHGFWEGTGG